MKALIYGAIFIIFFVIMAITTEGTKPPRTECEKLRGFANGQALSEGLISLDQHNMYQKKYERECR